MQVLNLLKNPSALFVPAIVWQVLTRSLSVPSRAPLEQGAERPQEGQACGGQVSDWHLHSLSWQKLAVFIVQHDQRTDRGHSAGPLGAQAHWTRVP